MRVSFKSLSDLLTLESCKVITFEDRIITQLVSRGFYSAVAITQSILTASDLEWKPYDWDSLFEGLIPDYRDLPITGISCDNADAFCHAVGGELCHDAIASALTQDLWNGFSTEHRKHYGAVAEEYRKRISDDEMLGGRYAAKSEFYLLKALKDHDVGLEDLCRLPLLVNELTTNTKLEERDESWGESYVMHRADFLEEKARISRISIGPDSVHDAGFRCVWTREGYERFLEELR